MTRTFLIVHGIVQGVGYRSYVRSVALKHGVKGFVRNSEDGSVHVLAEADRETLDRFVEEIKIDSKSGPQVFKIDVENEKAERFSGLEFSGFVIRR